MMLLMKKRGISILTTILCSLLLTACTPQTEKEINKPKTEDNYPFYQVQNKKRYQAYQKQNPNLSRKDVIIRVNLNLDQPFYTNTKISQDLNQKEILVNKYFYLEKDYVPNNLIELNKRYAKSGIYLVEEAAIALENLVDAAEKEGITIRAISAYRSYAYQETLYNRYVKEEGSKQADTYSARPGFSEHQSGLCIDVDDKVAPFTEFEDTKSFMWRTASGRRPDWSSM